MLKMQIMYVGRDRCWLIVCLFGWHSEERLIEAAESRSEVERLGRMARVKGDCLGGKDGRQTRNESLESDSRRPNHDEIRKERKRIELGWVEGRGGEEEEERGKR